MTGSRVAQHVYGIMYGVHRTTIYLPEDLKDRLAQEARRRGVTEAQVIREALAGALARPRPRGGLLDSGEPDWAGRDEELLAEQGFGE
ncbi:MAG: CopG family transcriptional regulator [Actinomycetota bacterium]